MWAHHLLSFRESTRPRLIHARWNFLWAVSKRSNNDGRGWAKMACKTHLDGSRYHEFFLWKNKLHHVAFIICTDYKNPLQQQSFKTIQTYSKNLFKTQPSQTRWTLVNIDSPWVDHPWHSPLVHHCAALLPGARLPAFVPAGQRQRLKGGWSLLSLVVWTSLNTSEPFLGPGISE